MDPTISRLASMCSVLMFPFCCTQIFQQTVQCSSSYLWTLWHGTEYLQAVCDGHPQTHTLMQAADDCRVSKIKACVYFGWCQSSNSTGGEEEGWTQVLIAALSIVALNFRLKKHAHTHAVGDLLAGVPVSVFNSLVIDALWLIHSHSQKYVSTERHSIHLCVSCFVLACKFLICVSMEFFWHILTRKHIILFETVPKD